MPYIPKPDRKKFDEVLWSLDNQNPQWHRDDMPVGEINYVISSIIWRLFDIRPSYRRANELIGVLECVKQEFIRRRLNPYEDVKIQICGDIGDTKPKKSAKSVARKFSKTP